MEEKQGYVADFPSEIIEEGKVKVLVPNLKAYGVTPSDYAPSKAPVFYNPVMEFNRDLSVIALQAYQHLVNRPVSICEPLTSQGIRGIRYSAEILGIEKVMISDISTKACDLAEHNIKINYLQEKIVLKHGEANNILSRHAAPKKRFDIIDLDPFGTPIQYLDSAIRALRNNGLLAATATDLAPLCGVHAKACIRKYGGKPLRTEYCHELAVRLLCGAISATAAKYDVGVKILFSHSSDHYIRVYAQIAYGAKKADDSLKNVGYILHCFNCMHREIVNQSFGCITCPECGAKMDWAGPLWTSLIADAAFVEQMLSEYKTAEFKNNAKIIKLLSQITEEATMPPTYFVIDKLSGKDNLPSPSNQMFILALLKSGFHAVPTHFNPRGVKTDASATTMHKILRELTTQQ
jgi:tRNA (guanine26-N2/guanine27-N2)-dimethyltransferase